MSMCVYMREINLDFSVDSIILHVWQDMMHIFCTLNFGFKAKIQLSFSENPSLTFPLLQWAKYFNIILISYLTV